MMLLLRYFRYSTSCFTYCAQLFPLALTESLNFIFRITLKLQACYKSTILSCRQHGLFLITGNLPTTKHFVISIFVLQIKTCYFFLEIISYSNAHILSNTECFQFVTYFQVVFTRWREK